ncbi:tetratricopeptide repeat protein 12 isoform X3 [Girardinichthys multiradiatus]|uniref:tetratricopeptide repeat protein 12 isoform X3 n=1 Tax=Girardinichthys multiradiatus TaxID=208333 RepID=UPI001FADFEC3|nr:tetratricopeptide repeat protein 12 isoform X3 [Girardinichthys multiradiatus]
MMENADDFERFLNNVDKIGQLLEDFQSSDVGVQQQAVAKADSLIATLDKPCKTNVNKTTVNANPLLQPLASHNESQEHFKKIMERDAEERRIKRMAKLKESTALKDKGNEAYAQEDYETAVKYYSDGLAVLRDMQPLYTNRAQAFIKLKRYKEAISDCEWALKCNERCIKAYVHMGKAYLGLKKYNEAKSCFEKIQEIEPGKGNMIKVEYLDLVDLEEKTDSQERKARQELEKGERKATVVPQLLEKLSRPGQMPLYYCGVLESLSPAVTDCTGQTLFRLNNGFSIISSNDVLRSCLLQKTDVLLSQESCVSVLKLWRIICHENDENQKLLIKCSVARQPLVQLLTSKHGEVVKECLELLSLYSKTSHGRRLAIDNLNLHTLVRNLMRCISEPKQQQEISAVCILETFAAEDGFRLKLRNMSTDCVVVPFKIILGNISKFNQNVLKSLISAVGFLAEDEVICRKLAHEQECWEAFVTATQCGTSEYKDILYILLGLIINLSMITSSPLQEHAVSLCDCCFDLLKNADGRIVTKVTGVLSTVLPQSSEAVQHAVRRKVIQTMCWLLKEKGHPATKSAIKTLTVCTAVSDMAREELLKSDKKLSTLRHLLSSSYDEVISGNAALCLAHCFELEGVASHLLGTDIVLLLLRLAAGEAKKTAVQQNAAIALSKLCQSEPRHVHKLRELHGLEILHSCAKLIS